MDDFLEEVVTRSHHRALYFALTLFAWLLIVLFAIVALFSFFYVTTTFSVTWIVILLLSAGAVYFLFVYKDHLTPEIEYTFTNGEMDFAKVFGNKRRKPILTLRLMNVEAGGALDSETYRRAAKQAGVKKLDLTLNENAQKIFLLHIQAGTKTLILLEPSPTMLALMDKYTRQVKLVPKEKTT